MNSIPQSCQCNQAASGGDALTGTNLSGRLPPAFLAGPLDAIPTDNQGVWSNITARTLAVRTEERATSIDVPGRPAGACPTQMVRERPAAQPLQVGPASQGEGDDGLGGVDAAEWLVRPSAADYPVEFSAGFRATGAPGRMRSALCGLRVRLAALSPQPAS